MAGLNPRDSFSLFDISKLLRLSEVYPKDFNSVEKMELEEQLDVYHCNVRKDPRFAKLNGIADLARVMVETRKDLSFPLVYRLLKLAVVLPVATATVERCFSAMKIVKTNLRNRVGEEFLNACAIFAVERDALANVKDEYVIQRFPKMCDRKGKVFSVVICFSECKIILVKLFLVNYHGVAFFSPSVLMNPDSATSGCGSRGESRV
ncbi:uncharacterized protein [Rutidosis leptorrhynchoides]|uniref:uncharacterized protein n=1 Tax=Rutidosis leptorrhynchoides TaxID=125765 RepID=UPI003A99F11B